MWLQKLLFIVLLVTTWDVIAVLGQSFDLCLPEATIEPPSPRGAGDM